MLSLLNLCKNQEDFHLKLNTFFNNNSKGYCCAVNANIVVECFKKKEYLEIVKNASFNTCDGINVKRLFNATYKDKINIYPGPNLFQDLVFKKKYNHFFLGGQNHVLEGLKTELQKGNHTISNNNFYSPPFLPVDKFDYNAIASLINKQNPDIIWIGLGAPKQEIFMSNLLPHINKGLMIGVGAAFNYYSGLDEYKRAPYLIKKYHLEWLFRAFQEPNRIIKRQIKCLIYLPLIYLKEIKER
jgi:N-acetylglucosaminyldiphosphoundecaprenol N-acetyl-beta-D-mannosaminyltransferase